MAFDPSTATLVPEAEPPVSRRFDPTTATLEPEASKQPRAAAPLWEPYDKAASQAADARFLASGEPAPTAPFLYPGETVGGPASPEDASGSGLTAVPKSKLAPVFSAAKRGWEETPNIVGPEAEAWIKQHGGGDRLIGALNSPSLLLGAGMAGFRGAQELVNQELIPVVGEQGARDIAAMPEAFPTGLGHQPTALHDVATGRIRPPTPGDMGAYERGFARDRGLGIEARTPEEVEGYDVRQAREAANNAREPAKQLTGPVRPRPQTPEQAAMDEAAPESPPVVAPNAPPGTTPVPAEAPLAELVKPPAIAASEAPPAPRAPNPKLPEPGGAPIALGGPEPAPAPASPSAFDPMTATPETPVSGSYVMLDPRQLTVDPKRFQFKESNERGVTGALEGTDRWEPDLASPIMAWQANDGQLFVADGHQRHDLATRAQAAGQDNVQIPAKVYREADGYTPDYMRTLAAYKNISEGSGTAIDAAKVMRGINAIPANRALPSLPPKQQMVQQGAALAKLSDEAFGVVVNGIVPPGYAAHVGAMIADPAEQMGALTVLARAQPANSEQARMMVKDIINSGFAKQAADDQGRFPWEDDNAVMPLFSERARVLDNAMRNLRGTRRVFKAAVEGEDALTGAGNVLDTEGNVRAKTENERLLDTLERNATTHGPVSDAFNVAARELSGGRPVAGVVSQFLAKTRALVRSGQDTGLRPGDTAGGAGEAGAGEAEQPVEGQEGFFEDRVPLFSPVERAVDGLKQAKGTGEQMLAQIVKTPGVKPEELNWLNLPNWLRGQKSVTREQIADYVRANSLDVREATRGDRIGVDWDRLYDIEQEKLVELQAALPDELPEPVGVGTQPVSNRGGVIHSLTMGWIKPDDLPEAYRQAAHAYIDAQEDRARESEVGSAGSTKFGTYTLPGGENYREMLITLPAKEPDRWQVFKPTDGRAVASFVTEAEARADARRRGDGFDYGWSAAEDNPETYRSSHWDEPNVLAHLRFNERTAPDSKRVLFVEEVQSDWHQAGRRRGYRDTEAAPKQVNFNTWAEQQGLAPERVQRIWDNHGRGDVDPKVDEMWQAWVEDRDATLRALETHSNTVPNAPFKTTWPSLVMKRVIKLAVDNGFDRVAWAPGEVHADRYDLSRQIKDLTLHGAGDNLRLTATDHNNNRVIDMQHTTRAGLSDIIGAETAAKLLAQPEPNPANPYGARNIFGADLKVGGEGMKGFYDRILPSETNKIVGKYGTKVGQSEVGIGKPDRDSIKPDAQAVKDLGPEWDRIIAQIRELESQRKPYSGNTPEENRLYDQLDVIHARMIDETHARSGNTQPVHSVDITPALRNVVSTQGLGLFAGKRLPPPPKSGPDLFGGERAQAARRTPEPTIKGDQRQIAMPGMEPSAVQAQAARDQAGPRSNQQPANEGLFARPETPQPELGAPEAARPVSRWAQDNGPEFVDELHLIHDLNGGHAVAGSWVFERGRETGHEHLAVVENATGRIIHAGTVRQKAFVTFKTGNMLDARDAYTVHHNHPNSSSLSGGDITMLAAPGLSHVVAHAENGDTFHAALAFTGTDPRTSVIPEVAAHQRQLQQTVAIQLGRMENILVDMVKRGEITYPEANAALGDMINRILHADGIIHYVSTRELPKIIADRLKTVLRGRGHAAGTIDRSAVAVRPEERVAGLPRPDEREPLQGPPRGEAGGGTGPPRADATGQGQLLEGLSTMPPLPLRGGHLNVDILSDKTGLPRLMAEAKIAFSPTSLRGAQPMELAMRKHGAEAALAFQRAAVSLRSVRDAVDRLSRADQIDFTHRMETGQRQSSPALQAVADMLRTTIDDWAKTIQGMGKGYLQNAITDYMGHIWGNYREWAAGQVPAGQTGGPPVPGAAHAAAQGKRPLQGSGAFLKQRTFPTQLDGINAGLVPATYNPVDLQLLKIREMQKFYFGAKLVDYMKHTGMATWVPEGDFHAAEASGYVKLDDRIFQPQIRGAHAAGPVTPGAYYAIEPQARLFNRYMSQGIAGNSAWYDMFRAAGNALNSIQLAWPGFHTAFVTMDTANSRFALGLQQAAHGQIVKAAGSLALGVGPGAVVKSLVTGTRLRKALLDPAAASPEYRQLADDFIMGGGRLSMDQFYQSAAAGSFIHGWKGFDPRRIAQQIAQMYRDTPPGWRKQVSLPVQIVFRSLDTMMHPLMGWLVPRAKVGVFGEMMRAWHDANPNATPEERAAAATKAWDNTEDRLGQFTYDNVFWDKTLKDVAFIGFRSVGWNLGTVRAGAGAVADTGKFIADAARLRKPEFTGRMAYGIAQFMNQALLGATITYLLTGSGPQSWLDYFFPRTGGTTPQGEPERLTPPGYVKDWIEWAKAPAQTLANKVHPLISLGLQMKNNRDYYGGIIDASGIDPDVNMAAAYGDFLVNSLLPFTVRGYGRLEAEGASQAAKIMSLFGFNPAPKSIVSPERGEAFQLKDDIKAYRRLMREPGRSHVFTPNPP